MIEHPLVQPFVTQIEGSVDGVQGLPKLLTERLIKKASDEQMSASR